MKGNKALRYQRPEYLVPKLPEHVDEDTLGLVYTGIAEPINAAQSLKRVLQLERPLFKTVKSIFTPEWAERVGRIFTRLLLLRPELKAEVPSLSQAICNPEFTVSPRFDQARLADLLWHLQIFNDEDWQNENNLPETEYQTAHNILQIALKGISAVIPALDRQSFGKNYSNESKVLRSVDLPTMDLSEIDEQDRLSDYYRVIEAIEDWRTETSEEDMNLFNHCFLIAEAIDDGTTKDKSVRQHKDCLSNSFYHRAFQTMLGADYAKLREELPFCSRRTHVFHAIVLKDDEKRKKKMKKRNADDKAHRRARKRFMRRAARAVASESA